MFYINNNNEKTALIIPTKYHLELTRKLLLEHQVLHNISIFSIDTFFSDTLKQNNIEFINESLIVNKLELHHKLLQNNHVYASSTNYIDELYKFYNEIILSNVTYSDKNFSFTNLAFSTLSTSFNKVYILSQEDIYPIHNAFLECLNTEVIYSNFDTNSDKCTLEHDNIIQMLDYIIYDIYSKPQEDTLIICDDIIQQDYLKNQLKLLDIPFNLETEDNSFYKNKIKSLFNYINNNYNDYDLHTITSMIKDDKYFTINNITEQQEYLRLLYDLLYSLELFDINSLNTLFSNIYFLKDVNRTVLNHYLLNELNNMLISSNINQANIMIASSSFNSLTFKKAYVVDATLNAFNALKTSFIANQRQRLEISDKLLSNTFYSDQLKVSQQRLLNCAIDIEFHYSLNSIDNKPQSLAYFIDELNLEQKEKNNFYHFSIHQKNNNTSLLNNQKAIINSNIISDKFSNKLSLSATSLDTFYACPYKYFVSYLLKPKVNKGFSYLDLGSIYHKCLEIINQHLIQNNLRYSDLTDDYIEMIVKSICLESLPENTKQNYITNKININIINLISQLKNHEKYSQYKLYAAEKSLNYQLGNITITGNIDLIMNYKDYYYIIDYKSSTKKFNDNDFKNGLSHQLIVYLSLLKHQNFNLTGAFFKAIQTKYLPSKHVLDDMEIKQSYQDAHKLEGILIDTIYNEQFDKNLNANPESLISTSKFKVGRAKETIYNIETINEYLQILDNHCIEMEAKIKEGIFNIMPYTNTTCDYCEYKNICKISALHTTRKELEKNE